MKSIFRSLDHGTLKLFPEKFASVNGRFSIKLGAKVLSDPGGFLILSSDVPLDFYE